MNAIQQLLTEHMAIWTAADTEKKSGRGRVSGNAGSVYGIKKLRELILELAVRGKLVPQNSKDEPASELLKRIQAEKSKLVAEGKVKKDKPLVPVTVDEKPFGLPHSWDWVHLPDISDYKVGKTPSTKISAYWTNSGDGFNWVSIADLNHNNYVFETNKQITSKAVSEVFRSEPAPAGTILMSFKLTLGKISLLDIPAFHNEAIISIYPNQAVLKEYLFKVLPARAMDGDSKSAIKGNTLNSESIAALLIPLPPFAEQHRIVAKVDELMALCDQLEAQHSNAAEAHEKLVSHLLGTITQSQSADDFSANWQRIAAHFDTLFTTEASIDALKQTLLQLAVMGKLVPQDANDESASELLKRIQAEKANLVAEGKVKKDKSLAPIADDEKPFELAASWEWVRLKTIATKLTDGSHNPPRDAGNGIPMLSSQNINYGFISFDNPSRYVTEDEFLAENSRTKIEAGDVLLTIVGTLGRAAVVGIEAPRFVLQRSVAAIQTGISPRYLCLQFGSPFCISYFEENGKGTAQKGIYLGQLAEMLIVVPPLLEQHRIVAKVDELMALCDQLKTRITAVNQQQQKLADVLVAQAVTG